ncbi:MAG: hypothetical protein J0L61_08280 [Planctomycetes bacterium]|nr:hypothetical protein [Planctomycetota bacterium]
MTRAAGLLALIALALAPVVGAQDAPKPSVPPASAPPASAPPKDDLTNPITGSKPRKEAPKQEAPKQEAPKQEAPKQEAPKAEGKEGALEGTKTVTAGGLTFSVPMSWVAETPAKSMFTPVAQFRIPKGETGAPEDANVKVFTGIRGGVGPNIERWKGQIQNPDKPAQEKDLKVDGMDAHVLYTGKGTFSAGAMMGGGAGPANGYMIAGAIVVTTEGDVQFKATGPAAILDAQRPAWEAMVASIKKAK